VTGRGDKYLTLTPRALDGSHQIEVHHAGPSFALPVPCGLEDLDHGHELVVGQIFGLDRLRQFLNQPHVLRPRRTGGGSHCDTSAATLIL
jgi:hypothetical protein